MLGLSDPLNTPSTGPGFSFRQEGAKIPGVTVHVLATTGYQSGLVEAVYPFQGLYDAHLMAIDFSIPDWYPGHVLPVVVTRHYGEVQVLCDTEELVSHYREFFKDATRVNVELRADYTARLEEHHTRNIREGLKDPPPLRTPREVLDAINEMNVALHRAYNWRATKGFSHLIPGGGSGMEQPVKVT